ncbi:MAG: LamG-like jellyroll fold domain-containing protein [Flavobacteriales bacterium]
MNFDGTNDLVQTSFGGVLGTTDRTFEAWIKVNSGISSNCAISDYGLNAVGSRNTFNVGSGYSLSFISGGTNANISSASNAITPAVWTHVAFVLNSGTGYLYVNGTQVATGNLSTVNTPSGNTNLRIGERVPGGSIPFPGSIDEVRIWNYARSSAEINASMNDEFCSIPTGLVAYYKFNEGVAAGTNTGLTSAPDVSGSGNSGTLSGFSLSGSTSNWVSGVTLGTTTSTAVLAITECDSFTSPSGNYTWSTPGTYYDTIETTTGCDSAITIFLSINNSTTSTINASECQSYTSPSGNYTWTTSGTYMDLLQNASGCDSIITVNLEINNTSNTIEIAACDSFTSPSGNYIWTTPGIYTDTLTNVAGCDSLLKINLTITGMSVSTSIEETACFSYTSPSGLYVWNVSGIYTDTFASSVGCDSIVSIDLTIGTVDTSVTKTGTMLTSSADTATYQWIDCKNNEPIEGETSKSYQPSQTGNYAVVVTQAGCMDTSACVNVKIVGVSSVFSSSEFLLYPNPSIGSVTIDLSSQFQLAEIRVFDMNGKLVNVLPNVSRSLVQLELGQDAGLYVVEIVTDARVEVFRVIKLE